MASSISNTDQQILLATSAIITYVGGIMFLLGTVGSLMNMVVFCGLKSYRSLVTSAFLATTSFSNQLYLTFILGFASLSKLINYDISSRNSATCKSAIYITNVSTQISLTCLCLSSIDRYLMTSRSAGRRNWMTLKRGRLIIGACIIVWMCVEIPSALYTTNFAPLNLCSPSSNYINAAIYLNLIFAIFLPITILSVFGVLTWKNLGNTRLTALNSQVTRMILLDIIVVALSNIPLGIVLIYIMTNSTGRLLTPTETLLVTLAQLSGTIQASGSFYFYMIVSSTFRTNVKNMLCNVLRFWKPRITHRIAPTAAMTATVLDKIPNVVV